MLTEVVQAAITLFLPYFTPIVFIIGAVIVADRLRDLITSSFLMSANGNGRRTN